MLLVAVLGRYIRPGFKGKCRSVPYVPNLLISVFEERKYETEISLNVFDSVKTSDLDFSTNTWSRKFCQTTLTLMIKKYKWQEYHIFFTLKADCARLRGYLISKRVSKRLAIICVTWIEALVTTFTRYYDLAVSCNPFSKSNNRDICEIWPVFQLQFMKWTSDVLTFNHRSVSRNLSSKVELRQFGNRGNQRIWDCREPTG